MTVSFDMSEVKALAADLDKAALAADREADQALDKVAARFVIAAKAAAPVATGKLAGSIKSSTDGDSRVISASTDYASFVEFGTSDTGPQPFMWPQVPKATRSLAEALGDIDPFDR